MITLLLCFSMGSLEYSSDMINKSRTPGIEDFDDVLECSNAQKIVLNLKNKLSFNTQVIKGNTVNQKVCISVSNSLFINGTDYLSVLYVNGEKQRDKKNALVYNLDDGNTNVIVLHYNSANDTYLINVKSIGFNEPFYITNRPTSSFVFNSKVLGNEGSIFLFPNGYYNLSVDKYYNIRKFKATCYKNGTEKIKVKDIIMLPNSCEFLAVEFDFKEIVKFTYNNKNIDYFDWPRSSQVDTFGFYGNNYIYGDDANSLSETITLYRNGILASLIVLVTIGAAVCMLVSMISAYLFISYKRVLRKRYVENHDSQECFQDLVCKDSPTFK